MELNLMKMYAAGYPSHCMVGEKLFVASGYDITEEERFREGVSILLGGIWMAGWSITYALAFPRKKLDASSRIALDGRKCSRKKLDKLSFYVGECSDRIFTGKTAQQIIRNRAKRQKAEDVGRLLEELGIDETAESFCKVPMCDAGKDIWKYSVALGLGMNKKIFLFPWLPSHMLEEIKEDVVRTGRIMKERGLILLIPAEGDQFLQGTDLEYERCILTRVCGERMKRERILPD